MKGEFSFVRHPRGTYVAWAAFYVVLFVVLTTAFLLVAGRIRTYFMPTGSVQLSIPYKTYLVGEPITFTLKNNYNSSVYVSNSCPEEPLAVYRKESSGWVRMHDTTDPTNCPNT